MASGRLEFFEGTTSGRLTGKRGRDGSAEEYGSWQMKTSEFCWSEIKDFLLLLFSNCSFAKKKKKICSAVGDLCMASIRLLRDMLPLLFQLPCEHPLKVECTGSVSCPEALISQREVT